MLVSLPYASPDSTQLFNYITKDILPKGVYVYPTPLWIVPAGGLNVQINAPWVVRSADGMTIREEAVNQQVSFPNIGDYYVGLYAEYLVAPNPGLELKSVLVTDYNAWSAGQKKTFIIFARVNVTANPVTQQMIDITVAEKPRGRLPLQEDLIRFFSSSVERVFNYGYYSSPNTPNFPTNPRTNEVCYCTYENAEYIYLNGQWKRIDVPLVGSSSFVPNTGRTLQVPGSMQNRPYKVQVTPTSNTAGHLGEFWVIKGATTFTIFSTGSSTGTFDWEIKL